MIKFLIQRPIAVLMAFTACFIIGLVTYSTLPISLLPNIAIPEITIQVSAANTSARELENTIVKPLRSQLIQVSTLKDIHSESRDGAGIIRLSFDFGTNTDLAFIEVNEKIDAAMNYLPKETERPKVIKASATDIPVFYLNLTLKNDSAYSITGQQSFLDLCEFAESVIKRRIEQLEEVAMVDVTGLVERQVQIVPDEDMLSMLGISIEDIRSIISGKVTLQDDGPFERNPHYVRLSDPGHGHKHTGLDNEGFFGVGVKEGEEYRFSVWARLPQGGTKATLRIELVDTKSMGEHQAFATQSLTIDSKEWKKYQIILKPGATNPKAVLRIFLTSKGTVDLEHISLFPVDTWKGHENGLRKDLAQALADIHPGVFRFPGGCIVEGTDLATRYDWKKSVGPVENRLLNENR